MSNHCDGSSRMDRFVAVNTTEDGAIDSSEEGNEENTVVHGSVELSRWVASYDIEEDYFAVNASNDGKVDDDSVEVEGNGWDAEPHIIEDYFV